MPCPNNNLNPCDLKGVITTEQGGRNSINHNKLRRLVCTGAGVTLTIQERQRTFAYNDEDSFTHTGGVLCGFSDFSAATHTDATVSTVYTAAIAENYSTIDSQVIFMDLRHDIVVTREVTQSIVFADSSGSQILGRAYPIGVVYLHRLGPIEYDITTITRDKLNGETIASFTGKERKTINLATLQPPNWYPEIDVAPPFVIDNRETDGGNFYWPEWCQQLGGDQGLDETDRNTVRDMAVGSTTGTLNIPAPVTGSANGAWAVDKDDNRFYSQELIDGATKNTIINADGGTIDPATVYDAQRYYPIAPL